MTVGAVLAQARRNLGLSHEEISARTKVGIEKLEAIERDEFDRLPPPVYVKGYVRAFATEVGLDPDEMARRYVMQLEESARLVDPAPAAPRLIPLEPADSLDAFDSEQELPAGRSHGAVLDRGSAADDLILRGPDHSISSRRLESNARPAITPGRSRFALLLLAAGLVVAGFIFLSAPEHWIPKGDPQDARRATGEKPAPADPDVRAERSTDEAVSAPAVDSTIVTLPDVEPTPVEAQPDERAAVEEQVVEERPAIAQPADNVSGSWKLTNRVESSSYRAYDELTLEFRVELQQRGNQVTGTGHKAAENGRDLPPGGRTPIFVRGTIEGRRLALTFVERGTRRASRGRVVLHLDEDGLLRGRFRSEAARASGRALATRERLER